MKTISLIASLLTLAIVLSACGGSSEGISGGIVIATPTSTGNGHEIESFIVSEYELDPAVNSGNVTLSWEVSDASLGNWVAIYVSKNISVGETDYALFDGFCIPEEQCGAKNVLTTCTFSNSNFLTCNDLEAAVDLSDFLTSIPLNAYLILQVCNANDDTNCDTQAREVKFQ